MASVTATGLCNAVAFAILSFCSINFNYSGYKEEMEWHDKAMEELSKAREKWFEEKVEKKERMAMLRKTLADANVDIRETNKTLQLLRTQLSKHMECQPEIDDYYHTSDVMISYQRVAVGGMGAAVGLIASKIF